MKLYSKPVQAALLLTGAVFIGGQYAQAVDFEFGGQIRPRVEFVDEGAQGQPVDGEKSHTTMRTRVNVKANVSDDVSAFVQIQDVRTWGGEIASGAPPSVTRTGTSVAANGLDIHQAYVDLKNVLDSGLDLRIGRQEVIFDEHRLIGNIGWIQQAQSFDAAVAGMSFGDINVTAFYAQTVANDTHPTLGTTVSTPGNPFESSISGIRLSYDLGDGDRVTPYFYYALNPANTSGAPLSIAGKAAEDIETFGVYAVKHIAGFRVRVDGAYQFGTGAKAFNTGFTSDTDISAYMLTAAVGYDLDIANGANVTLWYDYLSGDDGTMTQADHEVGTFSTLYATNHAYYGHMDKFLAIPTTGLQDISVKAWVKPMDKVKLVAHFHQFLRAETLAAATPGAGQNHNLGQEIDLHAHYGLASHTKLSVGYSHYFGKGVATTLLAASADNGGSTGDTTLDSNWAYVMLTTNF